MNLMEKIISLCKRREGGGIDRVFEFTIINILKPTAFSVCRDSGFNLI